MNGKIGIIGHGVMGTVILRAVRNMQPKTHVVVCDRNPKRLRSLNHLSNVTATNEYVSLQHCSIVFLAVKPQDFIDITLSLKSAALLVSVIAGVSTKRLQVQSGTMKVVRTMPNIAAKFGKGFSVWTATRSVSLRERIFLRRFFAQMGEQLYVHSERTIDAATAVTGSGPAYLLYTLQCFVAGAVDMGFSKKEAEHMVRATFNGVHVLLKEGFSFGKIIEQIASKRGTTEAALAVFKSRRLQEIWVAAIRNAFERARTLSKLY